MSNPDIRDAHYEDVQHGILDGNVWDRLCDAGLVPHGVTLDEFIAVDHELVAHEPQSPPSLKEAAEMVERLQCFLQCTLHEDFAMP